MEKIKRFKLKPNADLSSIPEIQYMTYVHKNAVRGFCHTLDERELIDVCIVFPAELSEWNDFDYVLVLDDEFGQPFTPFYDYMNAPNDKPFPFLRKIIHTYNEFMSSLPYLEEMKGE